MHFAVLSVFSPCISDPLIKISDQAWSKTNKQKQTKSPKPVTWGKAKPVLESGRERHKLSRLGVEAV